jgi:hypothetical protein
VVFKGIVTAAASVALIAAPTVAVAQTAPIAAPASERVEGDEMFGRGGFVIPLIALIAVILGILAATRGGSSTPPVTP